MCKSFDFLILNGRKTGYIFCKFTSFQWNGRSVIDYVITPASCFDTITTLEIGILLPWLSDHCPLKYNFATKQGINIKPNNEDNQIALIETPLNICGTVHPEKSLKCNYKLV